MFCHAGMLYLQWLFRLLLVPAALSVFIAGCWLGWPSPAVLKIMDNQTDLEISRDSISWIVALMDFGNTLSPIPSGYLADTLGRKHTLLLTSFLYVGTWLLAIFGTSAGYLYTARIGAGIGKGVACTVVPMYLGEIAGVRIRGALSTIFTALFYSGLLFEYCVGPFVSYTMLNTVSLAVPVVFFFAFFCLPDSPYFLLMKERNTQARQALAWFRNTDEQNELLKKELDEMAQQIKKEMQERGGYMDLLTNAGNRKALVIVLFLSAFQRFGGVSPQLSYTTVTLPQTGGYFKPEVYMVVFGVTMVIGNFISTYLMDTLGRKPLLTGSCAMCAVLTGISAVFYWAAGPANDTANLNWVPYMCFVLYGISYGIGIGVIPTTFVGELFPTNVKSLASAIAAIFFGVSSFLINKCYLFVKDEYGVYYMFTFFTLCSITSVVFTVFVVFETKGKTFTQIQNELHNR